MDDIQKAHDKRNKAIYEFTTSDGWKLVKDNLLNKIADLQSIMNVEGTTPEEIMLDIKVRRNVAIMLVEWLKEVEGGVDQYMSNDLSVDESEMMHILRE